MAEFGDFRNRGIVIHQFPFSKNFFRRTAESDCAVLHHEDLVTEFSDQVDFVMLKTLSVPSGSNWDVGSSMTSVSVSMAMMDAKATR